MMDEPGPAELLGVVAEFLRRDVVPGLSGYPSYQARVSANVLEILARQWAAQGDADARERAGLAALLGGTGGLEALNAELCARIERGEVSLATPGLAGHLWETVLGKLAVDQPRYSAYVAETGGADASG